MPGTLISGASGSSVHGNPSHVPFRLACPGVCVQVRTWCGVECVLRWARGCGREGCVHLHKLRAQEDNNRFKRISPPPLPPSLPLHRTPILTSKSCWVNVSM